MKVATLLCILLVHLFTLSDASRDRNNKPYKVVCYLGSWAYYRPGDGKFDVDNIDPGVCTHLIYGFAKLNYDNTIGIYDSYLDVGDKISGGLGAFRRFNAHKQRNPHLTTLIAIGGWNEGSGKYSSMASNPGTRRIFVDSVVKFLDTHGFDGLDLDWEYPANRDGAKPDDKQHFVELVRDLKAAFAPKGYVLSAAVSAGKPTIDTAYDIPAISKLLDFINVMAYDFHGSWETFTGHNAPLYPKSSDSQFDQEFTVSYGLNYWLQKGADPKKLVLGMPLYGHSFTLSGSGKGFKAPASQAGTAGPFTRLAGTLGYNEICTSLKNEPWEVHFDNDYKVPYAIKGNQWIGYDDLRSIKYKVDFLKSKGLGGGMVWSIETDDFHGRCGNGPYPLLTLIMKELNGGKSPVGPMPTDNPNPPTQNPNQGGSTGSGDNHPGNNDATLDSNLNCKSTGWAVHPKEPSRFFLCVNDGQGHFTRHNFVCGPGTVFDLQAHVCKMA